MKDIEIQVVKSLLGSDIFEELEKSDIGMFKQNTKTISEPEEIRIALQIVPRVILSWLFLNLKHKVIGDIIDIDIPFVPLTAPNGSCKLQCNKLSADNYSGEIFRDNEKIAEFKYRTLPGIGLIIMSTFELYDINQLDEIKQHDCKCEKVDKLQDIIDERLKLHSLICDVVDKRISEREAINQLIQSKLNEHIMKINAEKKPEEKPEEEKMEENSKNKLKDFLEKRKEIEKADVAEDEVPKEIEKGDVAEDEVPKEIEKSEVKCPDCGSTLLKNGDNNINLCICYGEYMDKKIKVKKSEDNKVKLIFPKGLDVQNIRMLFNVFKNNGDK